MKKREVILLVLSMGIMMAATGCGCGKEVEDTPVATETVTETTEVAEEGYKIVKVDKEYPAVTTVDCSLLDSADAVTEVSSLIKETYVTVYGDVTYNGVPVDFYAVRLDDGSTGFIDGKNLDFNVALEEDYADSLVEVEGGDGEEVTEEVVESTENEVEETPVENTNMFNIVDCDPVTKYTNTNANIRAIPDKSGELVDTVTTNTELTVTGTTEDGSWSRTERNGVVCFVKSSLLSDTKTEVKQPSSSEGTEQSSSNSNQGSSSNNSGSSNSSTNNNSVLSDQDELDALLTEMFGNDGQGTGGYDGGTTGGTGEGGGMNVQ